MVTRSDGEETRKKILDAGCRVFGEKGFHKATHAEICSLANANTAAINYHFGSKVGLYTKAFEHSVELAESLYPIDKDITKRSSPGEKLKSFIWALTSRMFDQKHLGYFHSIRMMEHVNPTGLLNKQFGRLINNNRNYLMSVIRELLGRKCPGEIVALCERSIISQCLFPPPYKAPANRKHIVSIPKHDLPELIEHITKFSLAGIKAVGHASTKYFKGKK